MREITIPFNNKTDLFRTFKFLEKAISECGEGELRRWKVRELK